jgi:chromosome segregation ATPase
MTRDESRAQRFARTWSGVSLAILAGLASTIEPTALPILAPDARLPGPTRIQQSSSEDATENKPDVFIELVELLTAAQQRLVELSKASKAVAATGPLQAALRQENQKLRAEIQTVMAERGELETAKQAAEAHAAELTKTLAQATAQVREMDEKMVAVAVRWRNAQLNSSLTQAWTSGGQIEAKAHPTRIAFQSRIDELEGGTKQTNAETARWREKIVAAEQRIVAADKARAEAEARLIEIRDSLHRAVQEKARISADLASVRGELATAQKQVTQVYQHAATLVNERDELHSRLVAATARLGQSDAAKAPARE